MKNSILVLIIFISLALFGVSSHAQYRADTCGCPPPIISLGGDLPRYGNFAGALSPNGEWLAIYGSNGGQFIYLPSDSLVTPILHSGLPGEIDGTAEGIIWCPYDTDLLLVETSSDVDTSGHDFSVENLFIYKISTGTSTLINPAVFGIYGPSIIGVVDWLPTSSLGHDSIVIGYSHLVSPDGKNFIGIYCPETQALIPRPYSNDTFAWSHDRKHRIWMKPDTLLTPSPNYGYFIQLPYFDSIPLVFSEPIDTPGINGATFSPNDSLVAYWVDPLGASSSDTIFEQIWVCKTSAPTNIISVINFQCCFCTYSIDGGIDPVFITDSTLAVSMYHFGDISDPLWEISDQGCNIVRQLTFPPGSSVEQPEAILQNFSAV
ncbi:MAG TPA: hypothetical protein VGM92_06630, partial [Candidatus Kapabacteria bacterium]